MSSLRRVNSGESYVTPALAAQLLGGREGNDATAPGIDNAAAKLTVRERQIVALVGNGLSNLEIAEELALTESTIKHYMTRILQKLGLRNRTEAAIFARTGSASDGH